MDISEAQKEKRLIHDRLWAWTIMALDGLSEIAKEAQASSKRAVNLADKLELRAIEKEANAGIVAVARIFGK